MVAILADDSFKGIFLNESDRIPIQISLKFVPRSPIEDKSELVQLMAWHRTGDNASHYPNQCWASSLTHIYGTRWRWVNLLTTVVFGIWICNFDCVILTLNSGSDFWSTHRGDVMKCPALLALCAGNPPIPDGFPTQRVSNVELCEVCCY